MVEGLDIPKSLTDSLAQLSILFSPDSNNFRPVPEVNSRLSDVKNVAPAVVYRSLKTLVNINYYQKSKDKERSDKTGPNMIYSKTEQANDLKNWSSRAEPRNVIYSNFIHQVF